MRILVAEDEPVSRRLVAEALREAGYEVLAVADGAAALRVLRGPDAPKLAVLDWVMPGMDGVEVIRLIRAAPTHQPPYILVLTSREGLEAVLTALGNGASDYVAKSHDIRELVSRVHVGARVVQLQAELAQRVEEAERALAHIRRLQGLLPICSYCKKVRNDQNYWQEIEQYVAEHSEAGFSHGICPACYETVVEREMQEHERRRRGGAGKAGWAMGHGVERIGTAEELARCIAASADVPVLVLKHSTAWPVSAGARSEFLAFAEGARGVRCAEVLVREDRPLSLELAERTGVRHESPQVICLVGGRAVAQASHREITAARLAAMLAAGRR